MLVALPRLNVVMLVPSLDVKTVPVPEGPRRHTNDFVVVTFAGTDAVHTILKVLYGAESNTVTVEGSVCTIRPNSGGKITDKIV